MRRFAFPLILAGTFAVAALGAHAAGGGPAPARLVDVSSSADDTPSPNATEPPDAPDDSDGRTAEPATPAETPSADDDGPTASATPDAPDDSDGRADDDDGDDDRDDDGDDDRDDDDNNGGGEDRGGSNSGKG